MAFNPLVYLPGTRGSYTALAHDQGLKTRAGAAPFFCVLITPASSLLPGQDEPVPPMQSNGGSELSEQIERKLGASLEGISELATESKNQIRVTSSPEARAAYMDPWKVKNRRRIRLIEKKHQGSLSEKEAADLATLEAQFSAHLKQVAPRSRELLDDFSDYVARMKAKVAAKKGIKP